MAAHLERNSSSLLFASSPRFPPLPYPISHKYKESGQLDIGKLPLRSCHSLCGHNLGSPAVMFHNVCGNARHASRIACTQRVPANRKSVRRVCQCASMCVCLFVYESGRQCVNVCTINNQFVWLPGVSGGGSQSIYFYIFFSLDLC